MTIALSKSATHPRNQRGFSVIELLIVFGVITVLTAAALFLLAPARRAYSTEDAAMQIMSLMREAQSRALSQRQTMRLVVDANAGVVSLIDESTLASGGNDGPDVTGDDELVRQVVLPDSITVDRQPMIDAVTVNPPAAPFNFPPAAFDQGIWQVRFQSDGSATYPGLNPMSTTIFIAPVDLERGGLQLVRGITLFGPGGSTRYWKYDGNNFISGGRQ